MTSSENPRFENPRIQDDPLQNPSFSFWESKMTSPRIQAFIFQNPRPPSRRIQDLRIQESKMTSSENPSFQNPRIQGDLFENPRFQNPRIQEPSSESKVSESKLHQNASWVRNSEQTNLKIHLTKPLEAEVSSWHCNFEYYASFTTTHKFPVSLVSWMYSHNASYTVRKRESCKNSVMVLFLTTRSCNSVNLRGAIFNSLAWSCGAIFNSEDMTRIFMRLRLCLAVQFGRIKFLKLDFICEPFCGPTCQDSYNNIRNETLYRPISRGELLLTSRADVSREKFPDCVLSHIHLNCEPRSQFLEIFPPRGV